MQSLYDKLQAAYSKEQLFEYAAKYRPDAWLQINTYSGFVHFGRVVSFNQTPADGPILLLQIVDRNSAHPGLTDHMLCIPAGSIESTEIFGKENIMQILSMGKWTGSEEYAASGKLEVKQVLELFGETIQRVSGVAIGTPQITLPEDAHVRNRILMLTGIIQQAIIDLLKDPDAAAAWKSKYAEIAFTDSDTSAVKGVDRKLELLFPFYNLEEPLIKTQWLTEELMRAL